MTDSRLIAGLFAATPSLLKMLNHQLQQGDFLVRSLQDEAAFIASVTQDWQALDCLVLEAEQGGYRILEQLQSNDIFLPCVLITAASQAEQSHPAQVNWLGQEYRDSIQQLSTQQMTQLPGSLEKSINAFLKLPPESPLLEQKSVLSEPHLTRDVVPQDVVTSLSNQQRRLSAKLQERLGYFGVYYKRDPDLFLRRMKPEEKQTFLITLRKDYREIILNYFSESPDLNQTIDRYVTTAFLADVPTAQIVQIHMELMDDFSKQLKLEGRTEDILLDYRLTLIDTLANLCELYRRSIPRS